MNNKLRILCLERNITLAELAKRAGIDYSTITRWNSEGIEKATLRNLLKVCDVLNCEITDLYKRDGSKDER